MLFSLAYCKQKLTKVGPSSITVVLCTLLASAPALSQNDPGGEAMAMRIDSSAFLNGEEMPSRYTAEGKNISPPLSWTGLPPETKTLALIIEDPDAPDPAAPKMIWTHWIVYNLPPFIKTLPEGIHGLPPGRGRGYERLQKNDVRRPPPTDRQTQIYA